MPPPHDLVARRRAEPAGDTATDIIGDNHAACYSGGAPATPVHASGKVGSAFVFDGTLHLRVPDSAALRLRRLTAEAWITRSS